MGEVESDILENFDLLNDLVCSAAFMKEQTHCSDDINDRGIEKELNCSDFLEDFKHYNSLKKNHRHCSEISMEEEDLNKKKKDKPLLDYSFEQFLCGLDPEKAKSKTDRKKRAESYLDSDPLSILKNEMGSQQDEIEPAYERFWKAIKVDGKSYWFEDEDSCVIRYEVDKDSQREAKNAEKLGKTEILNEESSSVKTVPENSRKAKAKPVNKFSRKGEVRGKGKAIEHEFKVKEEVEDDYFPFKPSGKDIDEQCHAHVLKTLASKDGEKMVSSSETKDNESSDVEIIELENIVLHENGYTPFVPSKCFLSLPAEGRLEGVKDAPQSDYRERLMNLVKMPYDQKEFDNLWREMTYRKPVQGCVNLRGRLKLYSTKTDGKSYLDLHEDLRKKVDALRPDKRKIVYLLRGFFFWLQNTAHQDAFKPWLDSLYLNALKNGDF